MAIVALEVEIAGSAEPRLAEQCRQHPHHLGAFLVHGGGVEVGNLDVALRAHRMCEGAGVLRELHIAQKLHVLNPLDAARVHVGGELLIAEHGEAFLEAELEPVAAGNAVAGPVVEILVRHHRLDALVGGVRGGVRRGQHAGSVEDVEALVLHRPHVEVLNCHHHEVVEVVLAPEAFLVPAHGPLQRRHGVAALADVVGLRIDAQRDSAAGHGDELVIEQREVPGHQGEQIARLGKGVAPRDLAAATSRAFVKQVAAGKQDGTGLGVGLDGGGVAGEHVRAIGIPSDLAEPLGLALGAVHGAGAIQAFEGRVCLRADAGHNCERAAFRHVEQGQRLAFDAAFVAAQVPAVKAQREEFEIGAVEDEIAALAGAAHEFQFARHGGLAWADVEVEARLGDVEGVGFVVQPMAGLGCCVRGPRVRQKSSPCLSATSSTSSMTTWQPMSSATFHAP